MFVDSIGVTNVAGEVVNQGTSNVDFVQITVTFFDAKNNVLYTETTFTMMNILTPNQKSPFVALSTKSNLGADHYSVVVSDASYTTTGPANLTVQGTTSNIDQIGYYHVVGQVTNAGTTTSSFTQLVVTFYDSSGKVIDAATTFSSPTDLQAGETGSFDALTPTSVNLISSYVVQAQSGL